jgi:hypothetical protein
MIVGGFFPKSKPDRTSLTTCLGLNLFHVVLIFTHKEKVIQNRSSTP